VAQTVSGAGIVGATVTLLMEDPASPGTFNMVPNGSNIMSASNRANPDQTNGFGEFGWDVIPGTYRVRAEFTTADGVVCTTSSTGNLVITTQPITGLVLQLECFADNLDPNELIGADTSAPIGATPELDSLMLFGSGLAGMGGYALTRLRARRRRNY
jgi:hypothetical protein